MDSVLLIIWGLKGLFHCWGKANSSQMDCYCSVAMQSPTRTFNPVLVCVTALFMKEYSRGSLINDTGWKTSQFWVTDLKTCIYTLLTESNAHSSCSFRVFEKEMKDLVESGYFWNIHRVWCMRYPEVSPPPSSPLVGVRTLTSSSLETVYLQRVHLYCTSLTVVTLRLNYVRLGSIVGLEPLV